MLREDFCFHIPRNIGDDPWDDRLFFKRLDGDSNLNFLDLEQFPEEIKLIREILIGSFNEPATEFPTQRDVAITDGGNKYEQEVPKGNFKGLSCLILRRDDILNHLNDLPDTKRRIAEVVRQNELPPPRVITESSPVVVGSEPSGRSNQPTLNYRTPATGAPTSEDREFAAGDIVFHSTFTFGTVIMVEPIVWHGVDDNVITVDYTGGNIRRLLLSAAKDHLRR
ncbi:MAG: hypothetical protein DK304_001476 [Chloroflexi bacterium]|jgi:hypothetical protein|nr:MAG: hypothetical protein DK304_001476 [Chloroflexota bacterium]